MAAHEEAVFRYCNRSEDHDQPSSSLKLHLYAKRFLHRDILVGTHEIPLEPTSDSPPTEHAAQPINARDVVQDTSETVVVAPSTVPYLTDQNPVETNTSTSPSSPADARVDAPPTWKARDSGKVTETSETAESGVTTRALQSGPSTSTSTERENTIDDILKAVERSSGVGKSSLINRVFGIDAAHVEDHKPGEADIQQEFVSPDNRFFVLHDSKGFEPGDLSNFDTVREFIRQRSRPDLPLGERIHGLWLCTETPTAGGRVFETGDEKLLQFAHKDQVPIVIVFTQYDRLVRTKEAELREDHPHMDPTRLHDRGVEEARKAFQDCLGITQAYDESPRDSDAALCYSFSIDRLAVRPHHQEDVSSLVKVTRDVVKERVKGDAWVLWAIAQRASLPVKIDACVTNTSRRGAPESGLTLLRDCIREVHKDIITCWNFKGEVLNSPEFRQLMLCLVQDVHIKPNVSSLPNVLIISQFVELVTAAPAPIAPPVAILGLSYLFVKWLSTTHLESIPSVQRLLIAYTVDLVGVLRELFDITLRPDLALTTTWKELQVAFESYERSYSRQHIHNSIYSNTARGQQMTVEDISKMGCDQFEILQNNGVPCDRKGNDAVRRSGTDLAPRLSYYFPSFSVTGAYHFENTLWPQTRAIPTGLPTGTSMDWTTSLDIAS
ncbi:hypothetical protein EDB86DRAFT_2832575 [Lactarius hatsudake]|nr:hypothetical protein EDB86DRAFT_2832575 [Lactarius hatsudake]